MSHPWDGWGLAQWNRALLRHFFQIATDADDSSISCISVTGEELAGAAMPGKAPTKDEGVDAKAAFLGLFTKRLGERHTFSWDLKQARENWSPTDPREPPFVAHLLLTNMAASDVDVSQEGEFAQRLADLLGRDTKDKFPELAETWRAFQAWLDRKVAEGASYRALELPDPRHCVRIGFSLFLAFPPRRDWQPLRDALATTGLVGDEPTVPPVLLSLSRVSHQFSARFREQLGEFREGYKEHRRDLARSPFWSAIRQACIRGQDTDDMAAEPSLEIVMSRDLDLESETLILWALVGQDMDLPRESPLLVSDIALEGVDGNSDRRPLVSRVNTLESEVTSAALDDAVQHLLVGEPRQLFGRSLSRGVFRAIRDGVLLFIPTDSAYQRLQLRLPDAKEVNALVRQDLAAAYVRCLRRSVRGEPLHQPSRYRGWDEVCIRAEGGFGSFERGAEDALDGVLCLQPVLRRSSRVRIEGIRAEGRWLALWPFGPVVRDHEASSVDLEMVERRSRKAATLALPKTEGGDWPVTTREHPRASGEGFLLLHYANERSRREQVSLGFDVFGTTYREAPSGEAWFCEGATRDTIGRTSDDQPGGSLSSGCSRLEVPDGPTEIVQAVQVVEPDGSDGSSPADALATALAALAMRRSGLPRATLYELFAQVEIPSGVSRWELIRAWVEAGQLDELISKRWRSTIFFARRPVLMTRRCGSLLSATLVGLVTPTLRELFIRKAQHVGVVVTLRHGARDLVPPTITLDGARAEDLTEIASLVGLSPPQAVTPLTLAAVDRVGRPRERPPIHFASFRRWCWRRGRFVEPGSEEGREPVVLEWWRRPDAPDHFTIAIEGKEHWWSRSRTWALLNAYAASGRVLFNEVGPLDLRQSGCHEAHLPAPVARFFVACGAPPPGPNPDAGWYGYAAPTQSLRSAMIEALWPRARRTHGITRTDRRLVAALATSSRRRGHRVFPPSSSVDAKIAGSCVPLTDAANLRLRMLSGRAPSRTTRDNENG